MMSSLLGLCSWLAVLRAGTMLVSLALLGGLTLRTAAVPGYSLRTWGPDNGLPDSSVSSVLLTPDGYLWVGTYNGLGRFDGVQFSVFDNSNTPELHNKGITALFAGKDGTLWIGHSNGELTRYENRRFFSVETRAPWGAKPIRGIGSDEGGDLWLMNDDGLLARVRDGLVLTPEPGAANQFVGMARSEKGTIWALRNGTVSQLVRGQLQLLYPGLEKTTNLVQGIGASLDGGLWMVCGGQLSKWSEGRRTEDFGPVPWGLAPTYPLLETREGWLAAAVSDRGFYLCQPWKAGKALQFCRSTGLLSDWVTALSEDREGNLWVGTGGAGLHMVRMASVESVSPPDDWQGRPVLSVSAGRSGALWIGTEGAGVYRLENGAWENFGLQQGIHNLYDWSAVEDRHGELWVATWAGQLFHLMNHRFAQIPDLGRIESPITAILRAKGGGLWLGTGDGLARYQNGKTTWVGRQARPEDRFVVTVLEDPGGAVWFGTSGGGLGCLKDGELKQFRKGDGLGSDFVSCLHLDKDALWIGTSGGGLTRLRQGRFAVISLARWGANDFLCDIEEDDQGYFWLSSRGGIIRASKADLNRCADGATNEVRCLTFGLGDGMPTLDCSGGFQPAGCRSADGRLWFPTAKGLVTLDPKTVRINPVPPPVTIEAMGVDERAIALQQGGPADLPIPPGRHRFEFQYAGLSFRDPEKVRFKYRLEGLENEWVQAGTRRRANYSFLQPGRYHFVVTACNDDGVWSETGASINFEVLPYFWQTALFRVLCASIAIAGTGSIAWLGVRQQMRREFERLEKQRAIERERTRIAYNIHDCLGANLTHITMLSDPERNGLNPERAKENLNKIHRTVGELTMAMDETVWALNPEHDTLDSLVSYLQMFAQDFLKAAGVRLRLEMPYEIPSLPLSPEVRHNLFLAFKEALNNMVKHSAASEVRVNLSLEAVGFSLSVEDNGRGFDADSRDMRVAEPRAGASNGNGLASMRVRLLEIGGRCQLRSVPGQGTKVTFSLPLQRASGAEKSASAEGTHR